MEEFSYEIHDELGMHARPAGMLAKLASGYKSNIMIGCEKGTADAKRLITLMKLGIQQMILINLAQVYCMPVMNVSLY